MFSQLTVASGDSFTFQLGKGTGGMGGNDEGELASSFSCPRKVAMAQMSG